MILIKKVKDILFFSLLILLIIYLLSILGVMSFFKGLFKSILPFFAGLFISVCMEAIIIKFIKKGYKRKIVTIISYIGLILTIGILILLFMPSFINQLKIFINTLPVLAGKIEALLANMNLNISMDSLLDNVQIKLDNIIKYFSNGFSFIISVGIAFSTAFFISYDYEKIKTTFKKMIPSIIKDEVIYFFSRYIPFFSKYIYSLIIDSAITFIISLILFMLFRVEYALIGSFVITITNLIPFIGPLIGIIPLVIIGYSVSPYFAIISLVVVLVVQLVESNIIQPIIFNNVIKIHPIEGIIGVLAFSYLFGAIGVIFSPLLVVAFKLLFVEQYNKEEVTLYDAKHTIN